MGAERSSAVQPVYAGEHVSDTRLRFSCSAIRTALIVVATACGGEPSQVPTDAPLDGRRLTCDDPAVIMCEDFEDRAVGSGDLQRAKAKQNGWTASATTAGPKVISNAEGVYEGARALELTYPEGQNTGGGFIDTSWPGGTQTLYVRWYTKFSANFRWSFVATKHMEVLTDNNHQHHLVWFSSGGGTSKTPSNAFGYASWFPEQNVNGALVMVPDRWYCQEMRLTMNSAGQSDGYLQGWIDEVQHWEYPNAKLDDSPGVMNGMMLSGYWNCYSGGSGSESCTDPANDYHPLMQRWHDNIVVATQRIGCSR